MEGERCRPAADGPVRHCRRGSGRRGTRAALSRRSPSTRRATECSPLACLRAFGVRPRRLCLSPAPFFLARLAPFALAPVRTIAHESCERGVAGFSRRCGRPADTDDALDEPAAIASEDSPLLTMEAPPRRTYHDRLLDQTKKKPSLLVRVWHALAGCVRRPRRPRVRPRPSSHRCRARASQRPPAPPAGSRHQTSASP